MRTVGQGLRAFADRVPHVAARPTAWIGTRLLLAFSLPLGYPSRTQMLGDVARYRAWAAQIAHGHYPHHDPTWQYPPAAALVMLVPRWITHVGPSYHAGFVALMLVADLATYVVVRRHGQTPAAVWVVGGFLLGPLLLNRFDVVPTAFAVSAVAAMVRGDGVRGGVHLGVGTLVKAWPAVTAIIAPPGKRIAVAIGATATGVVALVVLTATGTLGDSTSFAHQQGARGVEIEAIAGLPWIVGRWLRGRHATPAQSYGAYEVHGGPVHVVTAVCTVLSVLLIVGFLYAIWVRKLTLVPAAVVLVVVLGTLLFARVLSPQYLAWPLGIAALASTRGGAAARSAWLVVAACAFTQLEYPLAFSPLVHARTIGVLLLLVRDAFLAAAAWWAVKALRPVPERA